MLILGLDPGLGTTGWGVIRAQGNRLSHIANGQIRTGASIAMPARLVALLRRVDAQAAVIVTAWNPFSEPLRSEQNHARQRQLLAQVASKGYRWLPAAAVDRTGKWPPEESLCVLDPDAGFLHTVLVQFEQNAVVEVTAAGARLVLHPGLSGATPASCPPPSSQ